MKRREFIKHLEQNGCELLREGARHTMYVNRAAKKASAVPRHRELNNGLCERICKDLEVPPPGR